MTTVTLPTFKRGDTFGLACVYKENNLPSALTTEVIAAQLRDEFDALVATLTAGIDGNQGINVGQFTLTAPGDTSGWPTGNLVCDIQITRLGVIRSSQTFIVPVVADVTRAA